ncbi:MAG: carbohydrate binding domain-containing protein [Candidatus Omnitrophota bacterium]
MKTAVLILVMVLSLAGLSLAADEILLIDGFEIMITGGPEGTVDFGAGNGSNVEVSAATDIAHGGKQSLKVTYDAVPGGYIWVARGYDLDAKNSGWLVKAGDVSWNKYNAIAFYMYGSDNKAKIAFDIKDNGGEISRYIFEDNFKGWKQVVCPFKEFVARDDWQPQTAEKNGQIDFPIKSYQFEPLPPAKGTLYLDDAELVKK